MSRIGEQLITIPTGITVSLEGGILSVQGPKGSLNLKIDPRIKVKIVDSEITCSRNNDEGKTRAMHGTTRQLVANMIQGVNEGWIKKLEIFGTGYKAVLKGQNLVFSVGYSHTVEVVPPDGIIFTAAETKVSVSGISKDLVGLTAAKIRKIRPPDAYKGKGIRYEGERFKAKPGKQAKVGGVAGAKGGK
jgi:large subunit ribosomal protein L6